LHLLLALGAMKYWSIHHVDLNFAFLNGELAEVIHVQQLSGS
jgi:hypothetical protein